MRCELANAFFLAAGRVYCRLMSKPRTLLVVNPQSQNGSLGKRWPQLSKIVHRKLGAFEEVHTRAANEATEITRAALRDGVELVVAIGGDGTINEVANGFFEEGINISPDAAMGIIPFGTGGDFRRSLRIPTKIEAAVDVLTRFRTTRIDIGKIEFTNRDTKLSGQRYFVNIASFGISGEIDEAVNSSSKFLGGRITFMLTSLKVAMGFGGRRVRLVFDGDEDKAIETSISTVAVANGSYFGGGMKVAPDAQLDDGLFDVVAIQELSRLESIGITRHLYSGNHVQLDTVSQRRAKSVHAEPLDEKEVLIDLDGEVPGCLPASFSILPQSLRLVIP